MIDIDANRRVGIVDVHGCVARDIPCRQCGYNIRGLEQNLACPECGTPVAFSLSGDWIRFSQPRYKPIRVGVYLLALGILIEAIPTGLQFASVFASDEALSVATLVLLVGCLPSIVGNWMLTRSSTPEPGDLRGKRLCRALRVCLVIKVVLYFFTVVLAGVDLPESAGYVIRGLSLLARMFGIAGDVLILALLRQLATAFRDLLLADRAQPVQWGIAVSGGVLMTVPLLWHTSAENLAVPLGFTILVLPLFAVYVLYLGFLFDFSSYIRQQVRRW